MNKLWKVQGCLVSDRRSCLCLEIPMPIQGTTGKVWQVPGNFLMELHFLGNLLAVSLTVVSLLITLVQTPLSLTLWSIMMCFLFLFSALALCFLFCILVLVMGFLLYFFKQCPLNNFNFNNNILNWVVGSSSLQACQYFFFLCFLW